MCMCKNFKIIFVSIYIYIKQLLLPYIYMFIKQVSMYGISWPNSYSKRWVLELYCSIASQQPQHTDLSESRWCRRSLCCRGAQEASRAAELPEPSSDGSGCSCRWSPERERDWSWGPPPLNTPTDTRWQKKSASHSQSVIGFVSKCVDVSVPQKTAEGTHFKSLDNCRVQRKPVGPSADFNRANEKLQLFHLLWMRHFQMSFKNVK